MIGRLENTTKGSLSPCHDVSLRWDWFEMGRLGDMEKRRKAITLSPSLIVTVSQKGGIEILFS